MKANILASWILPKEPCTVLTALVVLELPDNSCTPYSVHRQNVSEWADKDDFFWGHYFEKLEEAQAFFIDKLHELQPQAFTKLVDRVIPPEGIETEV
jgi:hypothetical protein